jgi:hypothetical protein
MHAFLLALVMQLVGGEAIPLFDVESVDVIGAPHRLDAADLDGDEDVDLFVVGFGQGSTAILQVLVNDGRGGFLPGWRRVEILASLEPTWDADLADTDDDGDVDVVYVAPYGNPRQRFNDGDGDFDATSGVPTFSYQFEHELADVDGDGSVDLLYYEPDDFLEVYFGTMQGAGDGTFTYGTAEIALFGNPEQHRHIAVGDVTGDGLLDAIFTSLQSGGVRFVEGQPGSFGPFPGWAAPQLVYGPGCFDAALVDLGGDVRPEIVASVTSLDSLAVLALDAAGSPVATRLFPAGQSPEALAAADFDLDGHTDLVVTNRTRAAASWLRGDGDGGLGAPESVVVGRAPTDVVAADFDGDGDEDLAVTCAKAGHVALLINRRL